MKRVKKFTAFVYILQEMKAVTKILLPWTMWNQDQKLNFYFQFALVQKLYAEWSKAETFLNLNYEK